MAPTNTSSIPQHTPTVNGVLERNTGGSSAFEFYHTPPATGYGLERPAREEIPPLPVDHADLVRTLQARGLLRENTPTEHGAALAPRNAATPLPFPGGNDPWLPHPGGLLDPSPLRGGEFTFQGEAIAVPSDTAPPDSPVDHNEHFDADVPTAVETASEPGYGNADDESGESSPRKRGVRHAKPVDLE